MEERITGVMIYYYFVCSRKLWYFCHQINMEDENENVQLGKLLDENSYKRDDKHIEIDGIINIDFIHEKNELHEIKKSKSIEEAGIDYPLLKKNVDVELSDEDCKKLDDIIKEIISVKNQEYPPKLEEKKICKKCAYYDLCFI